MTKIQKDCEYESYESENEIKRHRCKRGKRGYPGFQGPQGATGPTGPAGLLDPRYLELQGTTTQNAGGIGPEAGQAVIFDQVILQEGIDVDGSAAVIEVDGTYFIHYEVQLFNATETTARVDIWNVLDGSAGGLRSIISVPPQSFVPFSFAQEYFLLAGTTYEVYWTTNNIDVVLFSDLATEGNFNESFVPSAVLDITKID